MTKAMTEAKVFLWGWTRQECDLVRIHVDYQEIGYVTMPNSQVTCERPGSWYRTQQAATEALVQYLSEQVTWLQAKADKIVRVDRRLNEFDTDNNIWGG